MITDLHFIRPLWLLSVPILFTIWWFGARATRGSLWENYISKDMIEALRVSKVGASNHWRWALLAAWLVLALAMAGPSWHKTPLPTLINQQALVLALDLSPSMMAKDLAPDRLTRAKYKMIDMLRLRADSQVALVAYAGDAHIVSPLTDDPATIEALLSALSPGMMPSAGSNTEAAIRVATDLLNQANVTNGEILLITDGVALDAQATLRENHDRQHSVAILALGSKEGAPIPAADGGFFKTAGGGIVLAGVNHTELAALASDLGGRYTAIQNDDSDIQYLLNANPNFNDQQIESDSVVYDSWVDMGHWLVLLILPFAAYFFRKGLIFVLPLLLIQPLDSQAAWYEQFSRQELSLQDLWKTRNQQANELMQEQQYEQAAEKFNDPDWAAVARYRNGQYEQATSGFGGQKSVRNLYNIGNSLALEGDLENAIEAYEKVLEQEPQHEDAAYNMAIVEQMLAQNQKQSDQQESQESDEQSEQQDGEASDQQPQKSQNPQQSESGESEQGDEQESEQQQAQAEQQQDNEQAEEQAQQQEEQDSRQQSEQEQQSSDESAEQNEQQASAEQEQQEQQAEADAEQGEPQDDTLSGPVRDEQEPLQDSSEQWLRTIQDDPSGLLKRKFEYQAWQRSRQGNRSNRQSAKKQQRY